MNGGNNKNMTPHYKSVHEPKSQQSQQIQQIPAHFIYIIPIYIHGENGKLTRIDDRSLQKRSIRFNIFVVADVVVLFYFSYFEMVGSNQPLYIYPHTYDISTRQFVNMSGRYFITNGSFSWEILQINFRGGNAFTEPVCQHYVRWSMCSECIEPQHKVKTMPFRDRGPFLFAARKVAININIKTFAKLSKKKQM